MIEHAAHDTESSGLIAVPHLEAHGGEFGLEGPAASGGLETLSWDMLTEPLQRLNLATRCNLLLVVAACTGFAGIKALTRGPRAPAVAFMGPDRELLPSQILEGMKEFYRRLQDKDARLHAMAESASHQAGSVIFEPEPFVDMVYDVVVDTTIAELRRTDRTIPQELIGQLNQRIWDEMFMIDLYPENHERFGLDVRALVAQISAHLRSAG